MSLHKYIERVKFADYLFRKKATGNAEELAKKLGLSVSGTFKFIKELRREGFPIGYSKEHRSYYYTEEGRMVNRLFETEMNTVAMKRVMGGKKYFKLFSDCNYNRVAGGNFV